MISRPQSLRVGFLVVESPDSSWNNQNRQVASISKSSLNASCCFPWLSRIHWNLVQVSSSEISSPRLSHRCSRAAATAPTPPCWRTSTRHSRTTHSTPRWGGSRIAAVGSLTGVSSPDERTKNWIYCNMSMGYELKCTSLHHMLHVLAQFIWLANASHLRFFYFGIRHYEEK